MRCSRCKIYPAEVEGLCEICRACVKHQEEWTDHGGTTVPKQSQTMVDLKEVSELLGVSRVSVSNAIYGKTGTSQDLRAKVFNELGRLGYDVDSIQITKGKHRRTHTIQRKGKC